MPMNKQPAYTAHAETLGSLLAEHFSLLDLLPKQSLEEKISAIVLGSTLNDFPALLAARFATVQQQIKTLDASRAKVVVFGGGTGLANIIGGDSARPDWPQEPFSGLKEVFPRVSSVVCVTDDGGSTGELQKDLPLVALGDLRHVLISSIRGDKLMRDYKLDRAAAQSCAAALHALFNYRFSNRPETAAQLLRDSKATLADLPSTLLATLSELAALLYSDPRLSRCLHRRQCLGNLLLAAAIYKQLGSSVEAVTTEQLLASAQVIWSATMRGLRELAACLGAQTDAVLPCTTTLSSLQMLYNNGVLVTSESKSSQAKRGYPVDRVMVKLSHAPALPPEVAQLAREADIILFAPGSLYSSIIPVLQVPGIAEALRENTQALKVLVGNIWVQTGETDTTRDAPDRKFHVSDLIRAYHRNIPGGVHGLFSHVVALDMSDIPGSILQRYALEDKEPIYHDRDRVQALGFASVEARIFSEEQLLKQQVIRHDPNALAWVIKGLWALQGAGGLTQPACSEALSPVDDCNALTQIRAIWPSTLAPCQRYEKIGARLRTLDTELMRTDALITSALEPKEREQLLNQVVEIVWRHPDILLEHLEFVRGITLVTPEAWKRCQEWDNIFSFYDPLNQRITIRQDQTQDHNRFEIVFLVALGQSLLGNYAQDKGMKDLYDGTETVGQIFRLQVRKRATLHSFFTLEDIDAYLRLSRMRPSQQEKLMYTRVINAGEGFTPPGLFFGLFYAWYLDNRFAANIDYKMSIMRASISELIPEQARLVVRRQQTICFFRERVFQQQL
jgi:uncharacterized cofD-like protein